MNPPDRPSLSPEAQALLARRAAIPKETLPAGLTGGPLSYEQLTQWFFAYLHPDSAVFNLPKVLDLEGEFSLTAAQASLAFLVDRHAALRTTFHLDGAEPDQRVQPARAVEWTVHDCRQLPSVDGSATVASLLEADAGRPFDLANDQLIRATVLQLSDRAWRLQVTFHHIAFDGWSNGIFLAEFAAGYRAAVVANPAQPEPLEVQVADLASAQRSPDAAAAQLEDGNYWRGKLHGVPPLELPTDYTTVEPSRHLGDVHRQELPIGLWAAIATLARGTGSTPFGVAATALAVLVARRAGQSSCMLGILTSGRERRGSEALIGNFARALPLVVDLTDAGSFRALLTQVHRAALEAQGHSRYPVQQLGTSISPGTGTTLRDLFPVQFNFRNYPFEIPDNLPGLTITGFSGPSRGSIAPFTFELIPHEHSAELALEFDPDLFSVRTAERWLDGLVTLLAAAVADPDGSIATLPLMGATEAGELAEWNATAADLEAGATLQSLFAKQAAATPDRVAVRAPEGEWRFRELNRESLRIAAHLRAEGIGRGSVVAVCMDRSLPLVAALLGVLRAGAAYLPIDTAMPRLRLTAMLEDAGVTLMLSGPGTPTDVGQSRWKVVPWDVPGPATPTDQAHASGPDDVAYVLFTSGSTGRPKAAVILHSGIVNHLCWMQRALPLTPEDRVLQLTTLSFDVAVWEFWAPLVAGAKLILAPPQAHRDPRALIQTLRTERITVVQFVPTMLRAVTDRGGFTELPALRRILCGGEELTWDLVQALRRQHGAVLVNLYGPTEASIHAAWWVVDRDVAPGPVPLGRPISNMRVEVCDLQGRLLPAGTFGELWVAGRGVGIGYLGRPELTAERFLPDPRFPGERRYRTGDRGRWRHDGVIEFVGRLDHQIKLRGHRIELGEIESRLRAIPGIREAAVLAQTLGSGEQGLVAHVEPGPGALLDPASIRGILRLDLPDFMIPSQVIVIAEMPLLPSGKINRAALRSAVIVPEMNDAAAPADAESTLEFTLKESWRRLLGVSEVDLDDDFFALGGHSLLAARMVDDLARGTGFRLPLAALFETSTIRTLLPRLLAGSYPNAPPAVHAVQTGADGRTPFFMLTGDLTGGGFFCREMVTTVDPGQPIYAIAPALPTDVPGHATIEGMARLHLADIRQIQPLGPYRLGGYCVGGLVAYEMARQLEQQGERAEVLILVDPGDPLRLDWLLHPLAVAASRSSAHRSGDPLGRLAYLKRRVKTLGQEPVWVQVRTLISYPFRRAARAIGRSTQGDPSIAEMDGTQDETDSLYARMNRHHSRAQFSYRHGKYRGALDIMLSTSRIHGPGGSGEAWQRIAPGAVIHESTAGHTEIVFRELPRFLATVLARLTT